MEETASSWIFPIADSFWPSSPFLEHWVAIHGPFYFCLILVAVFYPAVFELWFLV
jgi:hypothetical protein